MSVLGPVTVDDQIRRKLRFQSNLDMMAKGILKIDKFVQDLAFTMTVKFYAYELLLYRNRHSSSP